MKVRDITCDTPDCGCVKKVQALGYPAWRRFVLTCKEKRLMWFDNPKCASMTMKENFDLKFTHAIPKNHTSYFKFVFVRNPYDRMVSNWKMFSNTPFAIDKIKSYSIDLVKNIEKINFKDFLKMTLKLNNHHWDEQYYFIRSKPDFIGRFENLQEDFNKLCELTNLPKKELPYKNATQHSSYENYYDDETRAIVAKKYAKDIRTFNYKFGS